MSDGQNSPATNDSGSPAQQDEAFETVRRQVTIINSRGLHARAAAKFTSTASHFEAKILVSRGEQTVSGLSIMGLMMLAAAPGSDIELAAIGADANAAIDALATLIADKFHEGDG
ncbi:MAG: HPr family phosphocarrier protein [Proteobacteria bacterium]|nr:HPr family phosphocarrier protein [Pseudomonadota bacterium]